MTMNITLIQKWTIQELQAARVNALARLDQPDHAERAAMVLSAIEDELESRGIPGMVRQFEVVYPGGFYGEKQADEERNYKVHASELLHQLLSADELRSLMDSDDFPELTRRLKSVVNATNLIQGSFEKPKLFDAVTPPEHTHLFFAALADVLWGKDDLASRFERWCDVLVQIGLNKWTYATYFLFLADPKQCMFVKPEMLKRCIDISHHWLVYESTPSSQKYIEILHYCQWLKSRIEVLKPRDMIDLHSFMWHMAPTGKWSDE